MTDTCKIAILIKERLKVHKNVTASFLVWNKIAIKEGKEEKMQGIIPIKGAVNFQITIDPSVWIFDDRKQTAEQVFSFTQTPDEMEEYTKEVSAHWDREIAEGAVFPPTLKSEKKYKKEELLSGTFFMPLAPFIRNAEPAVSAKAIQIISQGETHSFPLSSLEEMMLLFCVNGKPLKLDGPVHLYFKNKETNQQPIKYVESFIIA